MKRTMEPRLEDCLTVMKLEAQPRSSLNGRQHESSNSIYSVYEEGSCSDRNQSDLGRDWGDSTQTDSTCRKPNIYKYNGKNMSAKDFPASLEDSFRIQSSPYRKPYNPQKYQNDEEELCNLNSANHNCHDALPQDHKNISDNQKSFVYENVIADVTRNQLEVDRQDNKNNNSIPTSDSFGQDRLAKQWFPVTVMAHRKLKAFNAQQVMLSIENRLKAGDTEQKELKEERISAAPEEPMAVYGRGVYNEAKDVSGSYTDIDALDVDTDVPKLVPATVKPLHEMHTPAFLTARYDVPDYKSTSITIPMSPYIYEIARLRMEKLRLAEEYLLEQRRMQEMENLRGPKPGWYMLKDRTFNPELILNNRMQKMRPCWKEIHEKYETLEMESMKFRLKHCPNYNPEY